ncbi:VanZ family protein [Leifsonia sp. YAF41]|uniref:VanZ family protein n=1 Tax=Leifsonia sp. YAF41 TaxID=3233086 RepID=UPI003F97DAA7
MLRSRPLVVTATVLYLAFIGVVTLGPQPVDGSDQGWVHSLVTWLAQSDLTAWITYELIEFAANIGLFVPLGALLLQLVGRRRWWLVLAVGFALSCGIEFVQLFLPTRVSDVRDILANTLGAGIGAALASFIAASKARRKTTRPDFPEDFRPDRAAAS